jgi:hypothetical protein
MSAASIARFGGPVPAIHPERARKPLARRDGGAPRSRPRASGAVLQGSSRRTMRNGEAAARPIYASSGKSPLLLAGADRVDLDPDAALGTLPPGLGPRRRPAT